MTRIRLLVALGLLLTGGGLASASRPSPKAEPVVPASAPAAAAFGDLAPWFEENRGQAGPEADFVARAGGQSVLLTGAGPVFSLPGDAVGAGRPVRLGLVGGADVPAQGLDKLPGTSNHLLGNDPAAWRTGVPQFGKVAYRGVWPGIDLVYHGQARQLEYDFVVLPGADPSAIAVAVEGADGARLTPEGDLVVRAGSAEIRQSKPVLYQEIDGARRPVAGSFTLDSPDRYGFRVGSYDLSRPLIIDPVLSWSTNLGGTAADSVNGIAVDAAGSAYVTGSTGSTDFPTANPLQATRNGAFSDAFVAKLNPGRHRPGMVDLPGRHARR